VWEAGYITGMVRLVIVTGFSPHYTDMAGSLRVAKGMTSVATLYKSVDLAKLCVAVV